MSGYFVDKMTATIENERKLTHEKVRPCLLPDGPLGRSRADP